MISLAGGEFFSDAEVYLFVEIIGHRGAEGQRPQYVKVERESIGRGRWALVFGPSSCLRRSRTEVKGCSEPVHWTSKYEISFKSCLPGRRLCPFKSSPFALSV